VKSLRFSALMSAVGLAVALGANNAHAVGAPAGTPINNTATVDYTVGTVTSTATSNLVSVVVAEKLDVNVTAPTGQTPVAPGTNGHVLRFRLDNLGNGPEAFRLTLNNAIATDNFDPVAASPSIYMETVDCTTAGAGVFEGTDVPYVAGSEPSLNPDECRYVYLVNNIPASATDGQIGQSSLTAEARTGTGPAGTVFAGQGALGTDAVVGTTLATDVAQGDYLVQGVTITAAKTQTVLDEFGGARPIPHATITYTVAVNAVGTGTATASVFADNVPAGTTYVPGSLTLNGGPMTDNADADVGAYETVPQPRVRVALGDLKQTDGTQTIRFAVTIN
jgi:uncharacterized repeat protein (TIGR01451 family)